MVCDAADRLQVTIIVTWGNSFLFKICLRVEVKYYDITELLKIRYNVYCTIYICKFLKCNSKLGLTFQSQESRKCNITLKEKLQYDFCRMHTYTSKIVKKDIFLKLLVSSYQF